jgi:hypothetical protein
MIWYDVSKKKPLATETRCCDGKRSDKILVCTRSRQYHVAVMYHTIMDGSETFDFYDDRDYEIQNVQYWTEIDRP